MSKTVYFLGAGASYCFGFPLTTDIMQGILLNLKKKDLFQLDTKVKTSTEIKQEKDLQRFLRLLYPGLKKINLTKQKNSIPGITEVLSMVEHFWFYNIPPHPQLKADQLMYFKNLLNRALGEFLLDYELEHYDEFQQQLLKQFIKPFSKINSSEDVTVITTNYDLIIDYEFKDEIKKGLVDFGIPYRNVYNNKIVIQPPEPLFKYYKLHGSLSWLKCDMCGYFYINPEGSIIHHAFREKTDDDNTCDCDSRLRLNTVFVSPSFIRDIRDSNLLQIWKGALEAIRTADKLIIIGYSLPTEDFAIKSIFMRALNGRNERKKLAVEVIQCGSASRSSFHYLFADCDVKFYCNGFENYLGLSNKIKSLNTRPCKHECNELCV